MRFGLSTLFISLDQICYWELIRGEIGFIVFDQELKFLFFCF